MRYIGHRKTRRGGRVRCPHCGAKFTKEKYLLHHLNEDKRCSQERGK